ncbi:MAG: DUF995 domain-containing protein [Burkholderiales bacterium]
MNASKHLLATTVSIALATASGLALADPPAVLADLAAQGKTTLGKGELQQLLPGASMRRMNVQGSAQAWTNEPDGSFVVSSDNRGQQGNNSTARGTWKISDDGRYCVTIEWKRNPTEDWCRVIVKSGDGYYAARSDKDTERVYPLEIKK